MAMSLWALLREKKRAKLHILKRETSRSIFPMLHQINGNVSHMGILGTLQKEEACKTAYFKKGNQPFHFSEHASDKWNGWFPFVKYAFLHDFSFSRVPRVPIWETFPITWRNRPNLRKNGIE